MSKHSPAHSMDAHTLDLLDFPLIVEALKERCLSEAGRQELDRQVISTDPDEVERRKQLAVSFRRLLESTYTVPWELDLKSGKFTFMGRQIPAIFYDYACLCISNWNNKIQECTKNLNTTNCGNVCSCYG